MGQVNYNKLVFIISVVIVQIAVKSVASSLSYENKNLIKIKQDPTRYQAASAYRNNNNMYPARYINTSSPKENNQINALITSHVPPPRADRNYSQVKNKIVGLNHDQSIPQINPNKKWQVGRVSRKQYEIINMLWRKTKIFADLEPSTPNYNTRRSNDTLRVIDSFSAFRQPFNRLPSRPNVPCTTPSYIEFYYLDEADERVKELTTQKPTQFLKNIRERQLRNLGNRKFVLSNSPMVSFRIDDPNYKRPVITSKYTPPTNRMKRGKTRTRQALNSLTPSYFISKGMQQNNQERITTTSSIPQENTTLNVTDIISTSEYVNNETCPTTTETFIIFENSTEKVNISNDTFNVTHIQESTTVYDKIKFFEMYDKQTPIPYYDERGKLIDMDNIEIYIKGNDLNNNDRKILLEHVDQSFGDDHTHKTKHAKKHIIDTNKNYLNNDNSGTLTTMKPIMLNVSKTANVTKQPVIKLLLPVVKNTQKIEANKSTHVEWSQYPFAAAYVYEPSQVHCDAAGISPHWLITSGSCLSRHHKNPGGEGRSAFVTYCGESWWNPERITYVKYSVVHPRFHPRDKTRRHLYNIGLIQVVTSMASACNGWSSISLMSHQFVAEEEGAVGNAIGWGLDRFDTRYSSNDLPKTLLVSYKNNVFSDSCPGNAGYSKAKNLDEEGGIKNVYCLALPPYSGEDTDPTHGGILLVGGKLVALYLQEERRPWGDQSAQYTGIWRLIPWVLDVARENEVDSFSLDI